MRDLPAVLVALWSWGGRSLVNLVGFWDFLKLFWGIYFLSLMSFMKDEKFHLLVEQPATFPHASTLQCLPSLHIVKSVPDDQAILLGSATSITANTHRGGCRAEDNEPGSQLDLLWRLCVCPLQAMSYVPHTAVTAASSGPSSLYMTLDKYIP